MAKKFKLNSAKPMYVQGIHLASPPHPGFPIVCRGVMGKPVLNNTHHPVSQVLLIFRSEDTQECPDQFLFGEFPPLSQFWVSWQD